MNNSFIIISILRLLLLLLWCRWK